MQPNDVRARGSNGPTANDATTTNPNCCHESLLIGMGSNDKMANNKEVVRNKGDQEEGEDNEGETMMT
ncbi:hypothetical protein L208DRAFT_1396919 [Tricholoma matsutake]|nr:hypothetical protein L208DRAFT_1396919 [Tricholoma matsutake 945]